MDSLWFPTTALRINCPSNIHEEDKEISAGPRKWLRPQPLLSGLLHNFWSSSSFPFFFFCGAKTDFVRTFLLAHTKKKKKEKSRNCWTATAIRRHYVIKFLELRANTVPCPLFSLTFCFLATRKVRSTKCSVVARQKEEKSGFLSLNLGPHATRTHRPISSLILCLCECGRCVTRSVWKAPNSGQEQEGRPEGKRPFHGGQRPVATRDPLTPSRSLTFLKELRSGQLGRSAA